MENTQGGSCAGAAAAGAGICAVAIAAIWIPGADLVMLGACAAATAATGTAC